jgi:hypothetical protein
MDRVTIKALAELAAAGRNIQIRTRAVDSLRSHRKAIERIIADPHTDERDLGRLRLVLQLLAN